MPLLFSVSQALSWPQMVAMATSADPLSVLLNYGLAGVVVFLVITGQLRTKAEVAALKEINAKQADIINAFQQALTGNALPAMTAGLRAVEAVPQSEARALEHVADTQRDMAVLVGRLEALIARGATESGGPGP